MSKRLTASFSAFKHFRRPFGEKVHQSWLHFFLVSIWINFIYLKRNNEKSLKVNKWEGQVSVTWLRTCGRWGCPDRQVRPQLFLLFLFSSLLFFSVLFIISFEMKIEKEYRPLRQDSSSFAYDFVCIRNKLTGLSTTRPGGTVAFGFSKFRHLSCIWFDFHSTWSDFVNGITKLQSKYSFWWLNYNWILCNYISFDSSFNSL